jgi:hypothetical protein
VQTTAQGQRSQFVNRCDTTQLPKAIEIGQPFREDDQRSSSWNNCNSCIRRRRRGRRCGWLWRRGCRLGRDDS